ncbi:MAG: tetratricopeptide repeat protein [Nitrospirae bacterium]|nr:tetratricopeptide repeat protein [Nitrospirota bacterium]MCL5284403.1 tetratricopeptide repeat protein [Nitrospirota bacterium]
MSERWRNFCRPFSLGIALILLSGCQTAVSPKNHHLAMEHYNAGLRKLRQQKLQGAYWEFEYANHLDPGIPKIHYSLGHVYYLMHDLPDAQKELRKALRNNPDRSSTYNYLGEIALEQKKYREALAYFHKALKNTLYRTPYYPLVNIGKVYMQMGKFERAKEYFSKALLRNDRFLPAHYWLGKVHMSEGAYEKALQDFSSAIRIEPSFSAGYYELGRAYLKLENQDKAARAFREAVRLDPNSKIGIKAKRSLLLLPKDLPVKQASGPQGIEKNLSGGK